MVVVLKSTGDGWASGEKVTFTSCDSSVPLEELTMETGSGAQTESVVCAPPDLVGGMVDCAATGGSVEVLHYPSRTPVLNFDCPHIISNCPPPTPAPTPTPPTPAPGSNTYDQVIVSWKADNYPAENHWEIHADDLNGAVLGEQDGLQPAGQEGSKTVTITPGQQLHFKITDDYSDGMCCNYGQGWLKVECASSSDSNPTYEQVQYTNYGASKTETFTCEVGGR